MRPQFAPGCATPGAPTPIHLHQSGLFLDCTQKHAALLVQSFQLGTWFLTQGAPAGALERQSAPIYRSSALCHELMPYAISFGMTALKYNVNLLRDGPRATRRTQAGVEPMERGSRLDRTISLEVRPFNPAERDRTFDLLKCDSTGARLAFAQPSREFQVSKPTFVENTCGGVRERQSRASCAYDDCVIRAPSPSPKTL